MFAPPSPRTATFGSLVSALSPPVLFSSLCGATLLGDVALIVLFLLTVYGVVHMYIVCVCCLCFMCMYIVCVVVGGWGRA